MSSGVGASDVNAASTQIRHVRIRFVDEIDVEFRRVPTNRHVIFGQIWIHVSARAQIGNRRFHQGRADAEKISAEDLAARELRIQNSPHIIDTDYPSYARLSEIIYAAFDKHGSE